MANLLNTALSSGLVNGVITGLTGAVTIQLVDGLTLTKAADKSSWADGLLTFTITIDNTAGTDPYTGVSITDTLDPLLIALVDGTVEVNGVTSADYTYDDVTGLLTVTPVPALDIAAGDSAEITFQVQRITP